MITEERLKEMFSRHFLKSSGDSRDVCQLISEIQRLRMALEFYADPTGWSKDAEGCDIFARGNVIGVARNDDYGEHARQALGIEK